MALIAAAATTRTSTSPGTKPSETTRWKRFRVHCGAMHGVSQQPSTLVAEEPGGLKLLAGPREEARSRRWQVLSGSKAVIDMARGFLFHRDQLRVRVQGKAWLDVRLPRPGEKKPDLRFVSPLDAFELQGNIAGREFEVRRRGRLIANVSCQRAEGDTGPRKDYVLESLKGEDPLPVVALVLAVEAAMGPMKS